MFRVLAVQRGLWPQSPPEDSVRLLQFRNPRLGYPSHARIKLRQPNKYSILSNNQSHLQNPVPTYEYCNQSPFNRYRR